MCGKGCPNALIAVNTRPMHFQIGDNFISDRHLKLAGRLWLCRRDYRKTGFLDDNRPDSPVAQHFQSSLELLRSGAVDIAELEIFNLAAKYYELVSCADNIYIHDPIAIV